MRGTESWYQQGSQYVISWLSSWGLICIAVYLKAVSGSAVTESESVWDEDERESRRSQGSKLAKTQERRSCRIRNDKEEKNQ